ncbi:SDR family oxidoreductase [Fodinicola feengrottensis]|uniref:NAD(P)H-binding protein n=1 Tax=Fodinicola feengrottensis TaxID=435914 RepID=A0ABN2HVY5_9ACTN|nr:NAD(P)H-binding protein [Fodinicola feengrottensis]
MTAPILVTGATGKVGRQVVSQLLDAGRPVRAAVRDPDRAALPAGVQVVQADLGNPDSIAAAADGVEAAFLLWPYLSVPVDAASTVVEAVAKRAQRLVALSSMGVHDERAKQADDNSEFHATIERLVERSATEWAFVRPGGFAGNTLGWAEQIRATGVVRQPFGELARPLIHEADIAAVAVAALTGDGHIGAKYAVSGPALVTQREQVAAIGAAIGRELRFDEIPAEQARPQLVEAGWPAAMADEALRVWSGMLAHPEPMTRTIEAVTGHPARTFAQWAVDHADDFR